MREKLMPLQLMEIETKPFKCPVCQGLVSATVIRGEQFRVQECLNCHMAVTLPASYVCQSDYNSNPCCAFGYRAQEDLTRHYARKILRQIRRQKPRGSLLDIGCSIGILVEEAITLGYKAQGIDLDGNAIAHGRSLSRPISNTKLEDIPAESFDVITLSHTLEHIPDPVEFLRKCRSKLTPGGCIAIVIPCHDSLIARTLKRRWYGWMPDQHYFHYSLPSTENLFEKAGLKTIKVFQESMDHRPRWNRRYSLKTRALSLFSYSLASMGHITGRGDQLVALACRQG
jgi:SAM-dependent methyltransferase